MTLHDSSVLAAVYKDKTGSEYLWDVYDHLQDKLRTYDDQYEVADANI